MAAPVVVVLEPINQAGIDQLAERCAVVQLTGPSDPRLGEALATAEALIVRSTRVSAELIAAAPNLRVIGRHGAGTDNIDLEAAAARGIAVVNTPRSNTESVAEYVITVALMLLKRIEEVSTALRTGTFTAQHGSLPGQVDRAGLVGREANGARLGLVGAGAIGRSVARRAQALGMTVTAYDPFISPEAIESSITFEPDLDTLLASVDIVSLHVPGGSGAIITAEKLALMKPGSLLINAARGELVDPDALAEALRTQHLGGAAVDVFDPEPPATDSALFDAPNLIATPHMAAMTREALVRMSVDVATGVITALGDA